MSPVSRGRGGKKSGRKKHRSAAAKAAPRPRGQQLGRGGVQEGLAAMAAALPGSQQMREEARSWWPASQAEVLAQASSLLDCTSPVALEDALCLLLGRHWQHLFDQHERGLAMAEWLEALIDAAKADADRPAVRRLLHGIAAIATPGLAGFAVQVLRDTAPDADEPGWLADTHRAVASPDVQFLRDGYGLRFGVLVQITGPSRPTRVYLMDVDLCHGMEEVVSSGYFPDDDTAAAAWRTLVGPSADDSRPAPADPGLLPTVLPGGGVLDEFLGAPLTDSQFTECFRGDRIVHLVAEARRQAGRPIRWRHESPEQRARRAARLTTEFRAWADTAGVDLPPGELVDWFLDDWVTTDLPDDLLLACSPHRIAAFTAYIVDDWVSENRDAALALLEPWVRYCIHRVGLAAPLAEHSLAWARRAAHEPEDVGGDLGNNLNRLLCETTVQPPTSSH